MKTSIYECLFCSNPQALINLDNYQHHWYDTHIAPPVPANAPPSTLNTRIEPYEEIGQLMSQAPSRSRGVETE